MNFRLRLMLFGALVPKVARFATVPSDNIVSGEHGLARSLQSF